MDEWIAILIFSRVRIFACFQ